MIFTAVAALHHDLYSGELYHWTDDYGVRHYADSKAKVPEKYLDQIKTKKSNPPEWIIRQRHRTYNGVDKPENGKDLKVYRIPFTNREDAATRRIIVNVKLNENCFARLALDTGSPGMVLSYNLAESMGILEEDKGVVLSRIGGIGGEVPAIRTIIDSVQIGEARDKFIPATITDIRSDSFQGLIGMDFMSNYSILIDHQNNQLVFTQLPGDKNRPGGRDRGWWIQTFREFRNYKNEWRNFRKNISEWKKNTVYNTILSENIIEQLEEISEWQYREASNLLGKLRMHASDSSVPPSWWQ